ncbi:MAG: tetratricopeptide repeat protein [Candidatus Hydrogenedentes bacterium]|nr:tetratricopeptide repeat protein [Candidatus Hydrogenedentota bacterium]
MKLTALLIGVFAACAAAAAAAPLPEGLQHLESIKDEAGLLQAVRDLDKQLVPAARDEFEAAKELVRTGKKDEAVEKRKSAAGRLQTVRQAYEYLLVQCPKNAHGHNYYGELLYDYFGEQAGALKEWNLAMSLDSQFSAPLNNLAIHYCHNGQYQLGFEMYDRALAIDPNHPDYLFNLAQAYLLYFPQVQELRKWKKTRVYKEAMKLSKKAAEVSPDDFELAQDYANNFYAAANFGIRADWAKAAKAWQASRNLARTDVERFFTWLNEGRVWIREGNKAKAAECLKEAVKLRPDEAVPKKLLAELQQEPAQSQSQSPRQPTPNKGRIFGR